MLSVSSKKLDMSIFDASLLSNGTALGRAISVLESYAHSSAENITLLVEELCSKQHLFEYVLSGTCLLKYMPCLCRPHTVFHSNRYKYSLYHFRTHSAQLPKQRRTLPRMSKCQSPFPALAILAFHAIPI